MARDDEQMGASTAWLSSLPAVAGAEEVYRFWSSRTIDSKIVSYVRYPMNQPLGPAVTAR